MQREVKGQAQQMHQSCCLPGSSVMNNLMTDVLDVWCPGITAVIESCHDAEAAEGQWFTLKDEAFSSHPDPFELFTK